MKTNLQPVLFIFLAGLMIPLAVALNARIGQTLKNPLFGAAAIPIAGLVFIILVMAFTRTEIPSVQEVVSIPWYAWLGGAMVTLYFIIMIFNAPKVGLGFAISLIVAGQLTMSMFLDHFGLLGLPVASFSWGRLAGAISVIAGVALIKYF
jgi:transporter family-2 protein